MAPPGQRRSTVEETAEWVPWDAAIAIMYVIGTPEAPDYSDGPRDGFMGELEDFCDPAARTFLADGDLGEAVAFLSDTTRTQGA
jgi:hypothetical protein